MNDAISGRAAPWRPPLVESPRPSDPRHRADPAAGTGEAAPDAARREPTKPSADAPLDAAVAQFVSPDPRLRDALGAPQFPLALKEALALFGDLANAAQSDPAPSAAAQDPEAAAIAALTASDASREPVLHSTPAEPVGAEDAEIFAAAADAVAAHLEARAAFRAGAAKLVKA